jgi:hypothetical protein
LKLVSQWQDPEDEFHSKAIYDVCMPVAGGTEG